MPAKCRNAQTNFLDVVCQRCGSAKGKPCQKGRLDAGKKRIVPSGEEAPYVHQARITASQWRATSRWNCSCGYACMADENHCINCKRERP